MPQPHSATGYRGHILRQDAAATIHPRKMLMSLAREKRTIEAMVAIYCRGHHRQASGLCAECQTLSDYALQRLSCCPFQANKPICANCTIHCYRKDMRAQVREVMRYAGPRMLWRHPLLALGHLLDKRKPVPALKKQQT